LIGQKLEKMGITLQPPQVPVANYVLYVRTGNLLIVSGHICYTQDGSLVAVGQAGVAISVKRGAVAARQYAINLLAVAKARFGRSC
jgi:hypothetical protein